MANLNLESSTCMSARDVDEKLDDLAQRTIEGRRNEIEFVVSRHFVDLSLPGDGTVLTKIINDGLKAVDTY